MNEPLTVVQKAMIKTVLNKHKHYPTELLFKEKSIINMTQLYINILMIIFVNKDCVISSITHNYQTRNAEILLVNLLLPQAIKSIIFTNS